VKTYRRQMRGSYGEKIRAVGSYLRGFRVRDRRGQPDPRLNDGWSEREAERLAREYGDFGDCWWPGREG